MSILSELSEQLQRGKANEVKDLVQKALDEGLEPRAILEEGLMDGMGIIGEKFKNNQVYVPEVLIAARAMNAGIVVLKPHLITSGVKSRGKVVLGTVKGDLHDIGKNLVKMMMEGKGLEVIDIGVDIPAEKFISTAIENDADIIACSALLTTTMTEMRNIVDKMVEDGVRDRFKIMVGGAPVTESFCKTVGADLYAPDASSAADVAVEYCVSKTG
ncbi:MAG: cobalamin-binding protein [Spirochaetaceae bacterium]|nr:MAG: cobalamin-binding protein [Spirochaetaceae bacterium]